MATGIQVVFDYSDPDGLARFWAEALGYKLQDPPPGYASWEDWARERGIPEERLNDASAIVDPDGRGPACVPSAGPRGQGREEPRAPGPQSGMLTA